ncbi:MAG: hypothetical protein AAF488_13170 [Planctomycetota bacterium]
MADPAHDARTGHQWVDVGVTGLAVLAFLGRGNTHIEAEKPEYQDSIRKAATWLLAQQQDAPEDIQSTRTGESRRTHLRENVEGRAARTEEATR